MRLLGVWYQVLGWKLAAQMNEEENKEAHPRPQTLSEGL